MTGIEAQAPTLLNMVLNLPPVIVKSSMIYKIVLNLPTLNHR